MYYIIVYDVGEERVAKVHKILKRYLYWRQRSVFEGELTDSQLHELLKGPQRSLTRVRIQF